MLYKRYLIVFVTGDVEACLQGDDQCCHPDDLSVSMYVFLIKSKSILFDAMFPYLIYAYGVMIDDTLALTIAIINRIGPDSLMRLCHYHVQNYLSIYLRVYSLHHNVLPTLQSIPLMTNGPLYPITQDSSCHGQHTMPRNPWSFPWPVPHTCVLHECVCVAVAESVRSSSVAVVSGICYSDHWWLQAYL